MKKNKALREFLIVALDFAEAKKAQKLVLQLGEEVLWYKVGMELFYAEGWPILDFLKKQGKKVFLDLKMQDIPRTVERACRVLAKYSPDILSVFGNFETVKSAISGLGEASSSCQVVNVSVLTSELAQKNTKFLVLEKTQETLRAGGAGVVASAQETAFLRQQIQRPFIIVNPGIRLRNLAQDDQKRTSTPKEAFLAGANYIVVGRPVAESNEPMRVVEEIYRDLECALP